MGDFADFFEVGFATALVDFDVFANQVINWLAEAFPVEGAIVVDGDMDDDVFAVVSFGLLVERVDEIHHIKTPLTEGGADWWASGGATARDF